MDQATQWEEKLAACREDLEASDARFRNTIENNADGILIVDMQGIVRFANPAAGAIFGQDPETLVDREFGFPLVTGGKAEVDLIRSPGETLTAEMRVTQTRWEDAPCRLVSLRDITERKQAEQDLEAYAADLARSNAELQRFAFVASHHLQEPLRTVVLHLQLLERRCRDQLDAKARRSIDYAVAGASHMRELIGDLLSYSQVDKRDIEFTPVDCTCVLAQTLDALQAQIAASEAEVTYDDLPTVDADKIQLRQVFEQLIENAIKFRREGVPPRVHVAAREGERGGEGEGEWVFSITDNGIGIDPDYYERIFDLFSRLHTQEAYPGTGIGLALCKKIVERHHGRMWIDSKPGEGTSVHFTLPA